MIETALDPVCPWVTPPRTGLLCPFILKPVLWKNWCVSIIFKPGNI